MRRRFSPVALLLLLGFPAGIQAQARLTGADLEGSVTDESGAAVPGAALAVTNSDTNLTRAATTDARGRYSVAALPPGTYRVSASLRGFATQTRAGVVLQLGQSVSIDFKLKIAGGAEEVTVTGEAPLVAVSHTEVSSVVDAQQIEGLPINGRNFISFSVITPGVTTDRTPQQGASATSGISFAGQRARSNNIMVDGLDNNDQVVGAVRSTFSQEAIREFQVLTNSYSAEFGKATGGVVNIVTKSGTNELHGSGFLYFRDDGLNAKNHFEKFDIFGNSVSLAKAPYSQKQWGATLGGPLRKDKTFFFLSFERTEIGASNLVTIQPEAAAVLNGLGFRVETGNVPFDVRALDALAKLNHNWSANHNLVVRANFADITNQNIEPFGGIVARSRGAEQLRKDWSLSAAQTDIFSNKWINELRIQVARQDQKIRSLDPSCNGPCDREDEGGPTLEVIGVATVGRQRFTPNPRLNTRYQFLDTLSRVSGGHHVKAGVEFNFIDGKEGALPLHFGGRYIFQPIPALGVTSSLDGLRRGIPAAYVQGYGDSQGPYDTRDFSLFVQDEWKLQRLVVKPGLRYQRQLWPDFVYNAGDLSGSTFSYSFAEDKNNLAPRLAVGYDLTGDGKTGLHASYGIFHDNTIAAILGVTQILRARDGVRTLVLAAPRAAIAWAAPGRRLSEDAARALLGGSYPSLIFAADPALRTPYAHQAAVGLERALGSDFALSLNGIYVRGYHQVGTIDYNPVLPASLGPGRRPNDLPCSANPAAACLNGGIAGTSASLLQYTSFGETWYKGVTASLRKRFSRRYQFLASYTLSKAEDNSTDFQSNFIPQNNGRGRNPADRAGLPLGFSPEAERGPATHDQRHRFVLSGLYGLPMEIRLSTILTAASGRPFTPLAGADLNGDGNGGAFPPDRARRNPADEASSVGRNSETTASYVNLDLRLSKRFKFGKSGGFETILDVFNVLNRANFFENTNQSSFTIFGSGAYPANPLPTYRRYTETLAPRQVQLAVRVGF
jgi:hypothetical protein